ncbi:hypothetical protein PSN01_06197 [Micromonospora saelicesensis]|nr:hypothetical protein PSN01_06197 [Micromonospora saelicesensis]
MRGVMCGCGVKETLGQQQDAGRATYPDDPDGGVLDGAPDAPWIDRWRRRETTSEPRPEPVATT